MTTTPIADLLGISTADREFIFGGRKFHYLPECDRFFEGITKTGARQMLIAHTGASESMKRRLASLLLSGELTDTAGHIDADAILSEARAAIAAQGGAE